MQDNQSKSKELEIAIKAAKEAGKNLEKYFETEILKEIKDVKEDINIVTIADRESEDLIKKIILENFPDHSILGEETGLTKNSGSYTWHIDPIDGTRNFANRIPFFALSIGFAKDNEILGGVIYNPVSDTLFYTEKGKGAYWNNKRIYVSKDDAKNCIVTVSSGRKPADLKLRRNLMHDLPENTVSAVRDFGCTALDLAYVAWGNTSADLKFGLKIHDCAAGILLIQEAGGMVTTIDGTPWKLSDAGYFIASNGVFHNKLVLEVKKQKKKLGIK